MTALLETIFVGDRPLRARLITLIASAYVPIGTVISTRQWWCGRVVHGPLRLL